MQTFAVLIVFYRSNMGDELVQQKKGYYYVIIQLFVQGGTNFL